MATHHAEGTRVDQKSSYEQVARQMVNEGAERVETGQRVTLRSGLVVEVVSGWAAWVPGTSKLVATGKVRTPQV